MMFALTPSPLSTLPAPAVIAPMSLKNSNINLSDGVPPQMLLKHKNLDAQSNSNIARPQLPKLHIQPVPYKLLIFYESSNMAMYPQPAGHMIS